MNNILSLQKLKPTNLDEREFIAFSGGSCVAGSC